jgi:aspartokinase/homoserine dehydrogenase 1
MRHHTGVSGKLFSVLGKNGINIVATAQGSSELNISVVIEKKDISKALNVIHDTFFFSQVKTLNLFFGWYRFDRKGAFKPIERTSKLFVKIPWFESKSSWCDEFQKNARNKRWYFDGFVARDLDAMGKPAELWAFVEEAKRLNLPNSVFADCTADKTIHNYYLGLFESNISVVTPNKVANSGRYEDYALLHRTVLKKASNSCTKPT